MLGRFIKPDPFVQNPFNVQNLNRYSYVLNNPVNFIDPSGYLEIVARKNWNMTVFIGDDGTYFHSRNHSDPNDNSDFYSELGSDFLGGNGNTNGSTGSATNSSSSGNGASSANAVKGSSDAIFADLDEVEVMAAQSGGGDPPNIMQAGVNPNEHWIGPTMIGLGSETISKPFSLGGKATKGTSIASSALRKALPYRSPVIKKITTNILGRSLSTSVLGGAIARSIPVLGWIWTGVDATIYFSTDEDYIKFQLNTEYNGIPTNAPKW